MNVNKESLQEILESIKKQVPKSFIIMTPNSIGETLMTCAFAKSFCEQHKTKITLCIRPEHRVLVDNFYPNRFVAIVEMHMEVMRAFHTHGLARDDIFDIDVPIVVSPLSFLNGELLKLHNLIYIRKGVSGLTYSDTWRFMLRLDWNKPFERPNLKNVQNTDVLTKYGLDKNEYVLFQLGNNTNKPAPAVFWESLEEQYKKSNKRVVANLAGAMLFDKHTKFSSALQINANIVEAIQLAFHSKATVSSLNGLMMIDLLMGREQGSLSHTHLLITDYYCEHYNLLAKDWDSAFAPIEGVATAGTSSLDYFTSPDNVSEWKVLNQYNDSELRELTEHIAKIKQNSKYKHSYDASAKQNLPITVPFGD